MRRVIVIFAASLCLAQEQAGPAVPATLTYEGKPLQVKPSCRAEDIVAAGLSCTEDDPCTLFLELANAATSGNRIVMTGNLHTTSSTVESVLLASDDSGRTWTEVHPRIPLSGLDQIQFVGGEYGWAAGETLLALPRDAFFLMTEDGGKTWRRRPVFSEARIGMIDAFRFDSRNVGTMIIDRVQGAENGMRYELYETMTGGDSWTLRQTSDKPIAIPTKAASEPGVRVRAESGTRTYRVEQRTGAEWQLLARFAIAAGECKPPEPAPMPEPAEPTATEEPPAPAANEQAKPATPSLKNGRRR